MKVIIRGRTGKFNARAAAALIRAGIARAVAEPTPAPSTDTLVVDELVPAAAVAPSRRGTYRRRDIQHAPATIVVEAEAEAAQPAPPPPIEPQQSED